MRLCDGESTGNGNNWDDLRNGFVIRDDKLYAALEADEPQERPESETDQE